MQLTIQEEITLQSRDMMLVMSKVNTQQSVPLWQTRLIALKNSAITSAVLIGPISGTEFME